VPVLVARERLIILHHAASSSASYRRWAKAFPDCIETRFVDLPGRGRSSELSPLFNLRDVRKFLVDFLTDIQQPFSVFGHSMGAFLAYYLALDLQALGKSPRWLGLSGCNPPFTKTPDRAYPINDDEIIAELCRGIDMPMEAAQREELLNYALPLARADFSVMRSERPKPKARLSIPITVFAGAQDPLLDLATISDWSHVTAGATRYVLLPGRHFFLFDRALDMPERVAYAMESAKTQDVVP
jgi:medium-chain acyl-[acyl-carrier-protein] hydrolase